MQLTRLDSAASLESLAEIHEAPAPSASSSLLVMMARVGMREELLNVFFETSAKTLQQNLSTTNCFAAVVAVTPAAHARPIFFS